MKFTKLLFLCLLGTGTLFVSSCGDDDLDPNEETNNRLDGDWEVTSFVGQGAVTSELLGNGINSVDLRFEKQDAFDGEYRFDFVFDNGVADVIRGDYEIENSGREIVLMPADNSTDEEYDIEINGDDLEMDGLFDFDGSATRVIIEAERD